MMKKIPCDFFGEGEEIYFNVGRLVELEEALKKPISKIMSEEFGLKELAHCCVIGFKQERRKSFSWYTEKLQELVDEGYTFEMLAAPVLKAIIGSGILGKQAYFSVFPEDMTEEDRAEEKISAEGKSKNSRRGRPPKQ